MLVNRGFEWLFNLMRTNQSNSPINFIAIGDNPSNIAINRDDIIVRGERFRKPLANITNFENTLSFECFLDRADANFTWREVGIFAGGNASPNTGMLIAKGLVSEVKDDMKTATIVWEMILRND